MSEIETQETPNQPALPAQETLSMLKCELELQKKHVRYLRDQNGALISCNRARFAQLQKGYVALLSEMDAQESHRINLLCDCSLSDGSRDWTARQKSQLVRLSEQIAAVSIQARNLNSQNRLLIEGELRYMNFMLDVMLDTARKSGNSYQAHGSVSPVQRSILINQAA